MIGLPYDQEQEFLAVALLENSDGDERALQQQPSCVMVATGLFDFVGVRLKHGIVRLLLGHGENFNVS